MKSCVRKRIASDSKFPEKIGYFKSFGGNTVDYAAG